MGTQPCLSPLRLPFRHARGKVAQPHHKAVSDVLGFVSLSDGFYLAGPFLVIVSFVGRRSGSHTNHATSAYRLRLPSAAESAVEQYKGERFTLLRIYQVQLRCKQIRIRGKHFEIAC